MNLNALPDIQLLALEALVDVGAAFVRTKLVAWHLTTHKGDTGANPNNENRPTGTRGGHRNRSSTSRKRCASLHENHNHGLSS
jgi:hypothetical protein